MPSAALEEAETVETLVYRLDRPRSAGRSFTLEARIVRPLKSGRLGAGRSCSLADLHTSRARYVGPEDRLIGRLTRNSYWSTATLPDDPETMALLMQHLLRTGRCYWREITGTPLMPGPKRRGVFVWRLDDSGNQAIEARLAEGEGEILPCAAPWYVDPGQNLAGPVDFGVTSEIAAAFLAAPPVAPNQAAALAEALARRFPGLGLPAPRIDVVEETRRDPPVPVLRLATRKRAYRYAFGAGRGDDRIDFAFLGYEYDGRIIDPASAPSELRHVENGRVIVRRRHYAAEAAFQRRLTGTGLLPTADFAKVKGEGKLLAFSFDHDAAAWADFVYNTVPALEQDGWRIEIEPEFRPRVVDGGGDWNASLGEGGGWWFSLDLGIEIDGERVPLLPVLTSLLRRVRDLDGGIDAIAVGGVVFGQLAGRPACRAAARPHQGDPRHARRAVPSGEPVVGRNSRASRWGRPSRSPKSRRRQGCAGSAASGCAPWPKGCAVSRECGRSRRLPACARRCANTSFRA